MNNFQRVIKYCAIGFAVFLTVIIISSIDKGVSFVAYLVTDGLHFSHNAEEYDGEVRDFSETYSAVTNLDISLAAGELIIAEGDAIKVEAIKVRSSFEAKLKDDGTLVIKDNQNVWDFFDWFDDDRKTKVILYLPDEFKVDTAKLQAGAGNVFITSLKAEKLIINAGAGNIEGREILADELELEGGVGNIRLKDVILKDSDIQSGVGNLKLEGELLGNNTIDCGVGEVDIILKADMDDYEIDIDSGIGTKRLNGEKVKKTNLKGIHAENYIEVNGGIGNVSIDFLN